jgi:UDP-N-acetyl-D-galactosamine dehydrogenase
MLGITFKENCPDIRNSKIVEVINLLTSYGLIVTIYDPWADIVEVKQQYGFLITNETPKDLMEYQAIVLGVAHDIFKLLSIKSNDKQVVYDVKGLLAKFKVDATL